MANSSFQFKSADAAEIPEEVDESTFVKICSKILGFSTKEI